MNLQVPDEALPDEGIPAEEMLAELAVALYRSGKITIGHGCRMTKLPEIEFQKLLDARGVDLRYPESEFERDLETLAKGL
ncbi:MAG: UPF0175 family protein [Thiohalocapsa sp. PB-PSB1]|jgi:predicted HTH domain antitoxin|nr:MAG: UPF0175 family protein [Thiohalocapsa sp. PB-PSB1]